LYEEFARFGGDWGHARGFTLQGWKKNRLDFN
jgi:hypothetical protein